MMYRQRLVAIAAWALALVFGPVLAPVWGLTAQAASTLRVTARVQAPAEILPGSTLQLELEVMTPTWFTGPPRLPSLDLPGVMVTPPSGEGDLVRATDAGVAYSGLRYHYVLSPTAAGTVQVPSLSVTAQIGPGNDVAAGVSKPLSFTVRAAAGATGTTGLGVVARHLAVTQEFSLVPDPPVAGGRITRSITQRAEGVQAMLLPAAPLSDAPGFKRYAREPEINTLNDGRGGFLGGQRIDRADYVPLAAGPINLPAVTVQWRDSASGKPTQTELAGRAFTIAAAPAAPPPFSLTDDLAKLRHGLRWVLPTAWFAWGTGLLLAVAILWLTWPWWLRGARALSARVTHLRARWRASEAWHWRAWRREAHRSGGTLSAFYRWLSLASGVTDLRAAVTTLDKSAGEITKITLRDIYGTSSGGAAGRARLSRASRGWRQTWRRHQAPAPAYALPATLNPRPRTVQQSRDARSGSQQ